MEKYMFVLVVPPQWCSIPKPNDLAVLPVGYIAAENVFSSQNGYCTTHRGLAVYHLHIAVKSGQRELGLGLVVDAASNVAHPLVDLDSKSTIKAKTSVIITLVQHIRMSGSYANSLLLLVTTICISERSGAAM
eukprot:6479256-Amphidinium_carterae.1